MTRCDDLRAPHRQSTNSPLGQTVFVGINPSKVAITKIKIDQDRTDLLKLKASSKSQGKSMQA